MKTKQHFLSGEVLLIDKPLHWTSFQVVNKIRWAIKKTFQINKIKVGHAGTLDPLATGLLILCTGQKTKQIETFQAQKKTYIGTFTLGCTRPSYDMETAIDYHFSTEHITEDIIKQTAQQFEGHIEQYPPLFSAIKKDGKRLYEYARAGKQIDIKSRKITIYNFEITNINIPEVQFKVTCSKGTYIRSLAHDFGKALQSGAYLSTLRRTQIGNFKVDNALSIEQFIDTLQEQSNKTKKL